jgi:hypothetical protein
MTDEEIGELEMRKVSKEKEVSKAFLQYIAGTGAFQQWEENRVVFESTHVGTTVFHICVLPELMHRPRETIQS